MAGEGYPFPAYFLSYFSTIDLSAEEILKTVDSMYHILVDLEKIHIDNIKAFEIFDDYFLNGYCCLMGFTDRDSVSGYEPTKLFFELFEWLI